MEHRGSEMEGLAMTDLSFYQGKRVLVTGHTGFKGAWLSIWLHHLGAEVTGIALDPADDEGVFMRSGIGDRIQDHRIDIRDGHALTRLFMEARPDIVFHLAARSLVLESYQDPVGTFAVNVMGTVNILEAIRHTPNVRAAVIVTTDKCYENREEPHGYRETDPMGGHDPYSASKGAAEIVTSSYRRSFFSKAEAAGIATARSGNVIGGGDLSKDRLVPDLIRAVGSNTPLSIRNPESVRPWQHVLEPLLGYLILGEGLFNDKQGHVGAWNFGPSSGQVRQVKALAEAMFAHLGKGSWELASQVSPPHEAHLLMLDINKAMMKLGWHPRLSFDDTVRLTAEWYERAKTVDVLTLCREQIEEYTGRGDLRG